MFTLWHAAGAALIGLYVFGTYRHNKRAANAAGIADHNELKALAFVLPIVAGAAVFAIVVSTIFQYDNSATSVLFVIALCLAMLYQPMTFKRQQ